MKIPKITLIMLSLLLILCIFISVTPTKMDINSIAGPKLAAIILNRIRDLCAIPLSFGLFVLAFGFMHFNWLSKKISPLTKKVRIIFLSCFLVMAAVGAYWSVGFVYLAIYPPMPTHVGIYLWEHSYLICLWWRVAGAFLLCSLS